MYSLFYGYFVGEGAGVLNIQAELDDGSLQSEIYSILDCSFYDDGVSGTQTNWYGRSGFQVSIDDTGTLLTNNQSGNANHLANDPNTSGSSWADTEDWNNCECKFEIVSYTGTVKYFNQNGNVVEITSTGEITVTNNTSTKRRLGFQLSGGATLRYKNFKIYPI